jgi:dolichyl-phosphate beta-glucosyltransferase
VPLDALFGPLHPAMDNRAFDTSKLGVGYGFQSHPKKAVEMPPTWALFLALAFMMTALSFWV